MLEREGLWEDAVEALLPLITAAFESGDAAAGARYHARAMSLASENPDSPIAALVLASEAARAAIGGDAERGLHLAIRAAEIADTTDDVRVKASSLMTIGLARITLEDETGLTDFDGAVRIADARDDPRMLVCYANAATAYFLMGDIRRSSHLSHRLRVRAEKLGHRVWFAA